MRKRLLLVGGSILALILFSALLEASMSSGGGTVTGQAMPAMPGSIMGSVSIPRIRTPLPRLLPAAADFPAPFDALVPLGPAAMEAALDITGVGVGASVDPAGCAPPPPRSGTDQTAVEVGTDDATQTTITILLSRADTPLTARRDQLTRCGEVTVTTFGAAADLSSRLQPPPSSVTADDVVAVDQTLTSHGAGQTQRRTLTTLLAQVGDVRVQATAMTFGGGSGDLIGGGGDHDATSAALDTLFTATVGRIHKG